MATRYAVRSFCTTLIALFAIGFLATSCKKNGGTDVVDPRDQYQGVYTGNYRSTLYINNTLPAGDPEVGTVQVTVSKAQEANQVTLDMLFNGATKQTLTAELTNDTFTIVNKTSEPLAFGGKTYDAQYVAQGQFVVKEKTFTLNTTAETVQLGVTLTKRGDVTGTMK
ncbi:hypothetical protein [Spirosoma panaciterrae]|uniref:hypothetical protein n=1 Tax=Spirosoma panaciterrae TaxID=496058 RepID=UPI0003700E25|nr:hypothetical protein [Spirosoma panaciterrae]